MNNAKSVRPKSADKKLSPSRQGWRFHGASGAICGVEKANLSVGITGNRFDDQRRPSVAGYWFMNRTGQSRQDAPGFFPKHFVRSIRYDRRMQIPHRQRSRSRVSMRWRFGTGLRDTSHRVLRVVSVTTYAPQAESVGFLREIHSNCVSHNVSRPKSGVPPNFAAVSGPDSAASGYIPLMNAVSAFFCVSIAPCRTPENNSGRHTFLRQLQNHSVRRNSPATKGLFCDAGFGRIGKRMDDLLPRFFPHI